MTKLHPTEGDVKTAVKKLLTQYGWWHFMPPANQYAKSGISDILALKRGRFLAIETKLKKTTGSANQDVFMQSVVDNGGFAMVVNMAGLREFQVFLERLAFEMGPWLAPPLTMGTP